MPLHYRKLLRPTCPWTELCTNSNKLLSVCCNTLMGFKIQLPCSAQRIKLQQACTHVLQFSDNLGKHLSRFPKVHHFMVHLPKVKRACQLPLVGLMFCKNIWPPMDVCLGFCTDVWVSQRICPCRYCCSACAPSNSTGTCTTPAAHLPPTQRNLILDWEPSLGHTVQHGAVSFHY